MPPVYGRSRDDPVDRRVRCVFVLCDVAGHKLTASVKDDALASLFRMISRPHRVMRSNKNCVPYTRGRWRGQRPGHARCIYSRLAPFLSLSSSRIGWPRGARALVDRSPQTCTWLLSGVRWCTQAPLSTMRPPQCPVATPFLCPARSPIIHHSSRVIMHHLPSLEARDRDQSHDLLP